MKYAEQRTQPSQAFDEIDRALRPVVLRYLERFVSADEADELAQITMIKVSEHIGEFRGDSSLAPWVHTIARNVALDRLRQRARDSLSIEPGGEAGDGDEDANIPPQLQSVSTETASIRAEMSGCVREFVDRLPKDHRGVLILADIEGMTNQEIAKATGLTLGTVKIRLHRARTRLSADLRAGCTIVRDVDHEIDCERRPLQRVK